MGVAQGFPHVVAACFAYGSSVMSQLDVLHRHGLWPVHGIRRLAAIAILSAGGVLPVAAGAADLVVQNGDVQKNNAPASYGSAFVSGTDAVTGSPSTYTANAPLTLTDGFSSYLVVTDSGVFNANASVSAEYGAVQVFGGQLNLASGTLSAWTIALDGQNAVSRTGGAYATVTGLTLANGATLDYTAADSIGTGANVMVSTGARLTLGTTLALTDYASQINLSGSGALDTQGNDFKTSSLSLDNAAALGFANGSEIRDYLTVNYGCQLELQKDLSMAPFSTMQLRGPDALVTNGYTFTTANLQLSGGVDVTLGAGGGVTDSVDIGSASTLRLKEDLSLTGGLTLQGGGGGGGFGFPPSAASSFVTNGHNYSVGSLVLGNGQSLAFGGASSIADSLYVNGGSTFVLEKDLAMNGLLDLSGSNPLVKNGHHVSAASLSLSGSAAMTYAAGDSITSSVTVGGNALPGPFVPRAPGGSLTLEQDLALTGALELTGSGALVTNGHNYSAGSLTLGGSTSLAYGPGDSITTSINVTNGSSLVLGKSLSLSNGLVLSGSNALVRNGNAVVAGAIALQNAAFTYGGGDSVTIDVNLGANSSFTLNKDLSVDAMEILGSGVFNANSHHYSVNQMIVEGGGGVGPQVAYTAGDSIGTLNLYGLGGATSLTASGSLTLQSLGVDNGGTLTAFAPVNVQSPSSYGITIYDGGKVQLENFTNVWSGGSWGLKWSGDHTTELQSYVIQEKVAFPGDYNDLTVAYDVSTDATYVSLANSFARIPLADDGSLAGLSLSSGTGDAATTASFAAGMASGTGGTVTWSFGSGGVLSVHGLDGVPQVLEMSYDPAGLSLADEQGLFLAWFDPVAGRWVNAVLGNHGTNPVSMSSPFQGSWASYAATKPGVPLTDLLGAYGVDTATHMVWAAINHNSDFSVPVPVPEPTAAALAAAGLAAAAFVRRTGRRRG